MASLSGVFNNQEFTDTGVPLSGGRIYTYIQGTTTQKDVYTDIAGTIPHTYTSDGVGGLYIGLNARGELSAPMYFAAGPYDICLKRADGSTVWTRRADGIASDFAASSGASKIGTIAPGSGATQRTQQDKNNDVINAKDYGMASANTAAQNMAALKLAIAATPLRGKLVISDDGGVYSIDTSGGLSAAAAISQRMVIQIDGDIQANFGTMQTNPPYIFKVTADRVTVTGEGSMIGNGTVDDTNAGDETTFPGLIYVTGNKFKCTIDTIDTPPKLAILLMGCYDAYISVRNWQGGVVTYTTGHTAYFGVRSNAGGRHRIVGNGFKRDASGGRLVTAFFALDTDNCTISDNTADVHEKLLYGYTNYTHVFGNAIKDAIQTDVIRIMTGSYNKIFNNRGDNIAAFASVYDGIYNEVTNNKATGIQQIAVYVSRHDVTYAGGWSGTKIKDNDFVADGGSAGIQDGILLDLAGADSSDVEVSGNRVFGFGKSSGEAGVRLHVATPNTIGSSRVCNNVVGDSSQSGIVVDRVTSSEISGNYGRGIAGYMLVELGGFANRFLDNRGKTIGSIGISGLDASSYGRGNQYTDAALVGSVMLAATVTTTVTHGGVAPNARIMIQETNTSAGVNLVSKGRVITSISGANFALVEPNGTAAAGTETFNYEIIQ